MRIAGERAVLRGEPRESDNKDHFRWRNLEEWDYYDEPWTPVLAENGHPFGSQPGWLWPE